jgi:hypothetical protein
VFYFRFLGRQQTFIRNTKFGKHILKDLLSSL